MRILNKSDASLEKKTTYNSFFFQKQSNFHFVITKVFGELRIEIYIVGNWLFHQ